MSSLNAPNLTSKLSNSHNIRKGVLRSSKTYHPNLCQSAKPPSSKSTAEMYSNALTVPIVNGTSLKKSDIEILTPNLPSAIHDVVAIAKPKCTCAIPDLEMCDHPVVGCLRKGKRSATLVQDLCYVVSSPNLTVIGSGEPEAAYLSWCHQLELEYLRDVIRNDGAKHWDDFIYKY